ncbi:MAG: hypothetical protein KDE33_17330 [Bacteroidetes bacterium]|nr:hypothetical protein [Bacteroidota bacterium]
MSIKYRLALSLAACFLIIMQGCVRRVDSGSQESDTGLDLAADLFRFSSRMTESDTLEVFVNTTSCEAFGYENNIITKHQDQVYIKTYVSWPWLEQGEIELDQVIYLYDPDDSLNLEDFFLYLDSIGSPKERNNWCFVQVSYGQDSICYYSEDLSDIHLKMNYYRQIKMRLYPEEKIYQPKVVIPVKPTSRKP